MLVRRNFICLGVFSDFNLFFNSFFLGEFKIVFFFGDFIKLFKVFFFLGDIRILFSVLLLKLKLNKFFLKFVKKFFF